MTDKQPIEIKDFIETISLPGELTFAKVWGSYSHNTNKPDSDIDYLIVYAAATRDVLSIEGVIETFDRKKPDFQAHEVRKFCVLLLKGNPGVIEMLFTDRMCCEGPQWKELKDNRAKFLSRQVIKQYLGYAQGQMKRLLSHHSLHTKGGKYNEKWAYHMIRLMFDCDRISKGDVPKVWKEGKERDLLMSIRSGQRSVEEVVAIVEEQIIKVKERKPWPLPEKGDREFLNEWLLKVRGI